MTKRGCAEKSLNHATNYSGPSGKRGKTVDMNIIIKSSEDFKILQGVEAHKARLSIFEPFLRQHGPRQLIKMMRDLQEDGKNMEICFVLSCMSVTTVVEWFANYIRDFVTQMSSVPLMQLSVVSIDLSGHDIVDVQNHLTRIAL
eukprot:3939390-Rhodomonas_salina.2